MFTQVKSVLKREKRIDWVVNDPIAMPIAMPSLSVITDRLSSTVVDCRRPRFSELQRHFTVYAVPASFLQSSEDSSSHSAVPFPTFCTLQCLCSDLYHYRTLESLLSLTHIPKTSFAKEVVLLERIREQEQQKMRRQQLLNRRGRLQQHEQGWVIILKTPLVYIISRTELVS